MKNKISCLLGVSLMLLCVCFAPTKNYAGSNCFDDGIIQPNDSSIQLNGVLMLNDSTIQIGDSTRLKIQTKNTFNLSSFRHTSSLRSSQDTVLRQFIDTTKIIRVDSITIN